MGASDSRFPSMPATRCLALLAAMAPLWLGCGSSGSDPDRRPLPPQTVSAVRPEPPPPSEPPVATPTPPNQTVIVLDPGDPAEEEGTTLAEAARRERERRKSAPAPVAVITNKNLAEYAEGETLTVASPEHDVGESLDADPLTADGHDEEWWRSRGLEIRRLWREAVDEVDQLEGDAAELRRRFYSTDDPYVRDAQVKPEWDRVLRKLEETRRRAEEGPREVERFLEEGRRAGALPGGLREGVELEPTPVLPRAGDEVEPGEPVIVGSDTPPGP